MLDPPEGWAGDPVPEMVYLAARDNSLVVAAVVKVLYCDRDLDAAILECGTAEFSPLKVSELGSQLRVKPRSSNIDPSVIGTYFRPQQSNLRSVDASVIIESPVPKKPRLVLFQMTVSASHPVNEQGLAAIWAAMPANLKRTSLILVFVVPADVARNFH